MAAPVFYSGCGVVFELSSSGVYTVLHTFTGGPLDGANPLFFGPVLDSSGNLYGTTPYGGRSQYGVLYEVTP